MPKEQHMMPLALASGVQHADDDYWYRPLVVGENLFTYVAHVLPRGYMAPSVKEAEMFELSLYMLEGALLIYYGDETFTIEPHTALFIPRGVPLGVRNEQESVATFVLTFTPPPKIESIEAWLAKVPEHKRKTAAEIRNMIGKNENA